MAKAKYLLQGLVADENHQNRISDILKKNHDEIIIYSAFLRETSIEDIKDELEANRGKVTAVIGIRNGVTSSQGLKKLLETGVKTYAVDTGSPNQIFHPKTLVAVNNASNPAYFENNSAASLPTLLLRIFVSSSGLKISDSTLYPLALANSSNKKSGDE